jgi:hypothetical protein
MGALLISWCLMQGFDLELSCPEKGVNALRPTAGGTGMKDPVEWR